MNAVYIRLVLYTLSTVLTALAGWLAGYGVSFDPDTHVISIHADTAIGAILGAGGLTGAIFGKWGVKG